MGSEKRGVMKRKVFAIEEMYKNIKTSVKIDGKRSKKFVVKVRAHQGSVFSPFLFVVVMDKITKDVKEGDVKEFLQSDDLVLLGDS